MPTQGNQRFRACRREKVGQPAAVAIRRHGGIDPLQGIAIAHAEMNALASVRGAVDLAECELWSTQSPCSMCAAAAGSFEMTAIHYRATDPSGLGGVFFSSGASDEVWIAAADALFLHNIAWVGGADNPVLANGRQNEPEIAALALNLLEESILVDLSQAGATVADALNAAWSRIAAAAETRSTRIQ